jgi:ABC-type multidrug transport system fused ATPase/permease subunit
MSSYVPIIGAFASFFELSVALNFAYAASSNFQALVKNGFLNDARKLAIKFSENIENVKSRLQIINEDVLIKKHKNTVLENLQKLLADLENDLGKLNSDIEEKQKVTSKQNKPIYIYIAVTSLFMLYLGGVEVIKSSFPTFEMFTMLSLILIFLMVMIVIMLFSDKLISVLVSTIILFFIIIIAYFFPFEIHVFDMLEISKIDFNLLLLKVSLALAFFPFIYSVFHFFIASYWIAIKFQYERYKANRELKNILNNLTNLQKSHRFFNENYNKSGK